jgi:beclin
LSELNQVEENIVKQSIQLEKLTYEQKKMELLENRFWQTCNEFEEQLRELQEERNTVQSYYDYTECQLQKLRATNVYNDTFHIWRDGHFGTINNLRMGTLQSQPVDYYFALFNICLLSCSNFDFSGGLE